jgi:DNA ligase (NAD+)
MNLFELENKYLLAKVEYYKGTPIMSDAEFDALEAKLKESGSKVTNQVGAKNKDFDFTLPNPMLSLSKLQTEANEDGSVNYMTSDFIKWYNKRSAIVGDSLLESSPKFDGNAIDTIYIGGKLTNSVTRGDGKFGKDVSKNVEMHFPKILNLNGIKLTETDVVEIRSEVVIESDFFNKKYGNDYSNPRNYVSGVLGADVPDETKCKELTIMPLHLLLNGEHIDINNLNNHNELISNVYIKIFKVDEYESLIDWYIELRKKFHIQLDGVVISFPVDFRSTLGENSHDPEWAISIKFVPDIATTTVNDLELFIGKTGEFTPVIQLDPVHLMGTVVRRASGYNFGYIFNNKIGKGATVSVSKSGDIIPEIQSVIIPSDEMFEIPTRCPHCNSELTFDGIHLMCNNTKCVGRIAKQLSSNAKFIDIKGVGPKTLENFATDFSDLIELVVWTRTKGNSSDIEKYGIAHNSRSHEIFLNAFNNIKTLTFGQVIVLMSYNNVGLKLADQIANMYNGTNADFTGHDRSIVEMFKNEDVKSKVISKVKNLIDVGIDIEIPIQKEITEDTLFVCMTGSPKTFGFATKKDFADVIGDRLNEVSITSKECQYLITDKLDSESSKMKNAKKRGIEIITYGDFAEKYS